MSSKPEGPFPPADRVPAAHDGPLYELEAIGRSLDDLTPSEHRAPERDAQLGLEWSAAAVAGLVALLGWLLVGR